MKNHSGVSTVAFPSATRPRGKVSRGQKFSGRRLRSHARGRRPSTQAPSVAATRSPPRPQILVLDLAMVARSKVFAGRLFFSRDIQFASSVLGRGQKGRIVKVPIVPLKIVIRTGSQYALQLTRWLQWTRSAFRLVPASSPRCLETAKMRVSQKKSRVNPYKRRHRSKPQKSPTTNTFFRGRRVFPTESGVFLGLTTNTRCS